MRPITWAPNPCDPRTYLLFFFVMVCLKHGAQSSPPTEVTIGAIFFSDETAASIKAFEAAVEYVNNETAILPSTQLKYIANYSNALDPLANVQKACYQISSGGVAAIFGPLTSTDVKAVSTITSELQVPLYAPAASNPAFSSDYTNFPFLLRMIPPDSITTQMIADLFTKFLWKRLAILSSNADFGEGATAQFLLIALEKEWSVVTTQTFEAIANPVNLDVREKLGKIKENGVRVVLVSCNARYVSPIMKQAKELDMIQGWAWIVLETGSNPSLPIPEETIGLLGVRATIDQGSLYTLLISKLQAAGHNTNLISYITVKRFDSVVAFAKGLHDYFQAAHSLSNDKPTCGSCQGDSESKTNGETLISYLKQVQIEGSSHYLNFSTDGSPGISKFEVVNLQSDGWKTVGNWDSAQGLSLEASQRVVTWPGSTTDIPVDTRYSFGNKTLKILTILERGFVQLKSGKTLVDPDPFEGLCIDLIKRLAEDMHFKYTLELVADGNYGNYDPDTNSWNGMVKELMNKKYDMVLAPITITKSRADVIDFSKPYMDLGLSILMKIPSKPETNIFGFVDPFSREVWLTCFGVMTVIAVISLLLDKISPNGYYGSVVHSELDEGSDAGETDDKLRGLVYLNLTSSMWFSIGALLQQGGDVLPRSISGRTVAAFWWSASMILIATYTANLAAFLTFSRMKIRINSVEQLASQMDVNYGIVKDSPAQEFFQNSILPSYNGMYQFMQARGSLVANAAEGIKRSRTEDFAFIYDSLFLVRETFTEPCDVFTVGQVFGKFGYGLAFQKNSPYTTRFSLEILHLREAGTILYFEDYWFKKQGDCTPDLTILQPSTGQLTLDDMIGVLVCVYFGIALGLVLVVVECCVASYWEVDPTHPLKPNTWREAMRRRLRRIWRDICNMWPNKLKCGRKSKNRSTVKVASVELDDARERQVKPKNGKDNMGYNGNKNNDVHPFQIGE